MRQFALYIAALAALALAPFAAEAQTIARGQTGAVGTVLSCTDTSGATVRCVVPMATPVTAAGVPMGSAASPTVVQGNVASGAADSGNPVKVGGRYNSTLPTLADGQRGDAQVGTRGSLNVTLCQANGTNCGFSLNAGQDALGNSTPAIVAYAPAMLFNGTTFDRAFTCPNSAVVNVTAAATTQIVALSASTQIRVCSIAISMSAAGTAKFLYGTGANCATGPVDLTAAMTLATGTPLELSASAGGSLLRTASSNALCVAAVTGNVVGFITYAQY